MPVSILATISPKPQHFAEARETILAIIDDTRAEAGCLAFDLHEGAGDGRFYLYEIWADRAAFDAHHAMAYTQSVFHKYEEILAVPVELVVMTPVSAAAIL